MQRLTPQLRDDAIPVSFAQEHMLQAYRSSNPKGAYNIHGAVRIADRLNVDAIVRSFEEVIRRHESLRTHFVMIGDKFIQVIDEQPRLDFTLVDLSPHPKDQRTPLARQALAEIGQRPFDIRTGPLMRIGLCRLADDDYFLIFVMHHLVSDAWSIQNCGQEFDQLYGSLAQGLPSPLPPLSVQYADFAIWQRNRFQGSFSDRHIAYWTRQLKGAHLLNLPTDRPRPNTSSYAGDSRSIVLSREMSSSARKLATGESVTLFILLFAIFAAVLSQQSGQEDVVVGTPIGTREPGTEKLIGFLTNTLPLRLNFSGDPCCRELLKQARTVAFEALAHHELPLVRLESELCPAGEGARRLPLFRVVFAMQNVPRSARLSSGLNVVAVAVDANTARRDLTFFVYDWTDTINGTIEYSTDIFDASTIESLLTQFERLLEFSIRNPEISMSKAS